MTLAKHSLLFLFATLPLAAQHADRTGGVDRAALDRIAPRMKQYVDEGVVSGVVTLVARHGKTVEFDAAGMADREANRPMRKDTVFQIMSMTKPVTAVGIMMLADEGKLTLLDPVSRFLPEFANQRVAATTGPENGRLGTPLRPITVRDLMTHTSGMMDTPPNEIKDYAQQMNIPLADLVRVYAKQPLLFQPGTHWSYSSPGIDILGRIIEVVSHQKYEDFMAQRILQPLGMKDSFYYPRPDNVERIAMVYESHNGKLTPSPGSILGGDPARHRQGSQYPAPGWGLYSTAEDLLHFYQMMLNDGVYGGHRYLSPFAVHLMTEVHTGSLNPSGWMGGTGYGLAWEVVNSPQGELTGHWTGTYGHGGAFGTQGWIDPSHDLIRIMLIQSSNGGTDSMRNAFMSMSAAAVD
jgi:CubicO group peptidase (beta-lactamase class C family)